MVAYKYDVPGNTIPGALIYGQGSDGKAYPLLINEANAQFNDKNGVYASANFTPAAAAYSAGDIMDVTKEMAWTYANGVAVPSGSIIRILTTLLKIDVTSVPAGQTSYGLQLYGVTPPSAQADNDAWTLASADLSAYVGRVELGSPVDLGASSFVRYPYIDFDFKLTGTSLFARLVTDGAHTAAAVARQVLLRGVVL